MLKQYSKHIVFFYLQLSCLSLCNLQEKPFVIIIPSYNNSKWVEKKFNFSFYPAIQ